MREQILRAVAMPPRLFWAPFIPACGNMAVQMACMFICMAITNINPLMFVASIVLVHVGLAVWGAKEPHLSNMAKSQGKMKMFCKSMYPHKGRRLAS